MAPKATYTLFMRAGWKNRKPDRDYPLVETPIDRSEMAERLGELLGFKEDYLERQFLRPVKVGQTRVLKEELGLNLAGCGLHITRVT